jgi:enoyl-CoA hydratase
MSFVRVEFAGPVATVTVDRPKALNALNTQTLHDLEGALAQVRAAPEVRALIVTGAGEKAFVAGADIAEMSHYTTSQALMFSQLGHRVFAELEALAIPTIAAVNGFALGGGCELALACDLVYASDRAKFGLPEVSLGVIPGFGGTQRLSRLLSKSRAKELVFTGDIIDAPKAKEYGFVLDVLAPDALLPHCQTVATTIAKRGPLAIAQAKRVIEAGADLSLKAAMELERQAFALLFGSGDQKEGMEAFLAKRPPVFKAL